LSQTRHQALCQDSVEQIRRREVSRILKMMELSAEKEEAIERFSYSLVAELFLGPISEVMGKPGSRRA
jgi:glutamyl-tRNA reductase